MSKHGKRLKEPTMSDQTLLITVEDLIYRAVGPYADQPTLVSFKLLQSVLTIMARQLRLLEQHVEIYVESSSEDEDHSPRRRRRHRGSKGDSPRKGSPRKGSTGKSPRTSPQRKGAKSKEKHEAGHSHGHGRGQRRDSSDSGDDEKHTKDKPGKGSLDRHRAGSDTDTQGTGRSAGKHGGKGGGAFPGESVGPGGRPRVGSIEVVTLPEFEALLQQVTTLQKQTGPPPLPTLPDNQQLLADVAAGTASLTDTMQAVQMVSRVQATEAAIQRLGELMTELASSGALPKDLAEKTKVITSGGAVSAGGRGAASSGGYQSDRTTDHSDPDYDQRSVRAKSVAIVGQQEGADTKLLASGLQGRPSQGNVRSVTSFSRSRARLSSAAGVTPAEMREAISHLRNDLTGKILAISSKAAISTDNTLSAVKTVSEKMDHAVRLSNRLTTLHSLVMDYSTQLSGFDAGLDTQMNSFRGQMREMRSDLRQGLEQLEQVNTNKETLAVMELTERYEALVEELDATLNQHTGLSQRQHNLNDDLQFLVQRVEMLGEEKADRDEVVDGLRDKADQSRLAGLLSEVEFAEVAADLRKRLVICYDKFNRQDAVWQQALKDLWGAVATKADMVFVLGLRSEQHAQMQLFADRLAVLAEAVGEPKAALVTRQMMQNATCGPCMKPAHMDMRDPEYGMPPMLPALRPPPPEPCEHTWQPEPSPDLRIHLCQRWVGGSHTQLGPAVTKTHAEPLDLPYPPSKQYIGTGEDGRMYLCDEEMQPCVQCNPVPPTGATGAGGDQA